MHHQYNLKSREGGYVLITLASHARNVQESLLLYFGKELKEYVALSLNHLDDFQSMDVVVSQSWCADFIIDIITRYVVKALIPCILMHDVNC